MCVHASGLSIPCLGCRLHRKAQQGWARQGIVRRSRDCRGPSGGSATQAAWLHPSHDGLPQRARTPRAGPPAAPAAAAPPHHPRHAFLASVGAAPCLPAHRRDLPVSAPAPPLHANPRTPRSWSLPRRRQQPARAARPRRCRWRCLGGAPSGSVRCWRWRPLGCRRRCWASRTATPCARTRPTCN